MIVRLGFGGRVVTIHGADRDHIFETIRRTGTFYELEMLECAADLARYGTAIDVGANIGNHTIFLSLFSGCQSVVSIEPYDLAFRYLGMNVRANGLSEKVFIHNLAAREGAGTCSIIPGPTTNIGHTVTVPGGPIKTAAMDDLIDATADVSVIKIDVEGSEMAVLHGAVRILSEQRPHLFVETETADRKDAADRFLRRLGYLPRKRFNFTATYLYSPVD